jgi:hypothetical protein
MGDEMKGTALLWSRRNTFTLHRSILGLLRPHVVRSVHNYLDSRC